MKPCRCWTLAVALSLGAVSAAMTLPANAVFARLAEGQAVAESVAPQQVPSADEAYRAGVELEKKQNYAEAMHSYRVAAEKEHTGAQIAIGNLYAEGRGVRQDYAAALRWYRIAADKRELRGSKQRWLVLPVRVGRAARLPRGDALAPQGGGSGERCIPNKHRHDVPQWFRGAAKSR